MKEVLTLLRGYWRGTEPLKMLLQRFGFDGRKQRNKVLSIVLAVLLIFSFFYFLFMLFFTFYGYQVLGMLIDRPYLGLFLASVMGFVGLGIFTLTSINNTLYRAPDVTMLRSLPISDQSLALSRLAILYSAHAPLYWFLTLPALVVGATVGGITPLYLLSSLIFLLCGPILSLSVFILFNVAAARSAFARKYPSASKVVAMLLFVFFFVGLSAMMTRYLDSSGALAFDYQAMMAEVLPLIARLERIFFPLRMQALGFFSPLALVGFVALALVFGALCVWIITRTFSSTVVVMTASAAGKRKRRRTNGERQRSPKRALFGREFTTLGSESAFVFEAVGELLIPLILILVWIITGTFDEIASLFEMMLATNYVSEIIFLLFLLLSNVNLLSSTSVSRQGKRFKLDRLYPLEAEDFVDAKLLFHLVLVGVSNLIYLAFFLIYLQAGVGDLLFFAVLSALSVTLIACLQLALDYRNPNEEWTLAHQAMKSNPNGLYGLLLPLLWGIIAALFLLLLPYLGFPHVLGRLLLLLLAVLLVRLGYQAAVAQARLALAR